MHRRDVLRAGAAGTGMVVTGLVLGGGSCNDEPDEPGTIRILSGADQSPGGQRHQLVDRWSTQNPDHPAEIIEVAGVADAQRSEMVARAQSAEPGVDVYNLDVTWTAEFAEAGYIHDLGDPDTDGFLPEPLRTCRYDGKLWALPFNTDAGLLFYRSDLVPEGPAQDWEGIQRQVDRVLGAAERPEELVAGFAGQLGDYEGLTVNALEQIWSGGGTVVDGDWREPEILVDSPEVEAALRRLARVFAPDDPLMLPGSAEFDEAATTEAFREGKILFMRNWPVAYRSLQADPDAEDGAVPASTPPFEVASLPGPSVLGGQNLAVARHSPRRRSAQRLIEFLTSGDSQRQLFLDGGLAATRSAVYDDDEVVAVYPYASLLRETVRSATRRRPETPYYARFSEVFRRGVKDAMRAGGTPPHEFDRALADAMRGRRP